MKGRMPDRRYRLPHQRLLSEVRVVVERMGRARGGGLGQGKGKGRAISGFGLYPDPAALSFEDPAAQGKSDTDTGDIPAMQTFEGLKDELVELRVDANSVVAYLESADSAGGFGGDRDLGAAFRPRI